MLIFVLAGLGIVLELVDSHQVTATTIVMLAIAVAAVAGFFLTLNFGDFNSIVRRLIAFGEKRQWAALNHVADFGARLQQLWRNGRGLAASFIVHFAGVCDWSRGSLGRAFVHGLSGEPGCGDRDRKHWAGQPRRRIHPAGGVGVQDGALIAASAIFGVPPEVGLAMALIKRVPDLVLGIPALFAWQALEGRRLLSGRKTMPAPEDRPRTPA